MKTLLKRLFPDTHPLRLSYHRLRSWLAALQAGFPARKLKVIAVTGTDGKTTTVSMIAHILTLSGRKAGAVSTAFFEINGVRRANPTQKTSIEAKTLQNFLRKLVREGCEYAVIETSSHGLMQGRFNGIKPQVAAITNVTMEHLDYHGTMDEYIRAKAKLFWRLGSMGTKVLNEDDVSFAHLYSIPSSQTIAYAPSKQISNVETTATHSSATLSVEGKRYRIDLSIPGAFNVSNALCALSAATAVGISIQESLDALTTFRGAPGRMESLDIGQPFRIYIDFTVTPVAYEATLASLKSIVPSGKRLLVLTGSCGNRMREKNLPLVGIAWLPAGVNNGTPSGIPAMTSSMMRSGSSLYGSSLATTITSPYFAQMPPIKGRFSRMRLPQLPVSTRSRLPDGTILLSEARVAS